MRSVSLQVVSVLLAQGKNICRTAHAVSFSLSLSFGSMPGQFQDGDILPASWNTYEYGIGPSPVGNDPTFRNFRISEWSFSMMYSRIRMYINKLKIYIYIYIHTWNPNDPGFGWNFGLVLGGWPSKIEVIGALGMYIYNLQYTYNFNTAGHFLRDSHSVWLSVFTMFFHACSRGESDEESDEVLDHLELLGKELWWPGPFGQEAPRAQLESKIMVGNFVSKMAPSEITGSQKKVNHLTTIRHPVVCLVQGSLEKSVFAFRISGIFPCCLVMLGNHIYVYIYIYIYIYI